MRYVRTFAAILASLLPLSLQVAESLAEERQSSPDPALLPGPIVSLYHDEQLQLEQALPTPIVAGQRQDRFFGFNGSDGVPFNQGPFRRA